MWHSFVHTGIDFDADFVSLVVCLQQLAYADLALFSWFLPEK
jgi:hypothetical protein